MSPRVETSTVEAIVEPVCRAHGLELVQVVQATERGRALLRVIIDRVGSERGPGFGVTLADCQAVSRDLGPALDVHDLVGGAYSLEVSSPGLDRPLVKQRDYERFMGQEIKVQTHEPLPDGRGGERRKFKGKLVGVDAQSVRIEAEGTEQSIPYAAIAKANVVPSYE